MKNKICPICKNKFIPNVYNQIYCSKLCKWKRSHQVHRQEELEYKKQYRKIHKEEIKEYMKDYRKQHIEPIANQRKQYRKDNKNSIKKYMKQYFIKYQKITLHKLIKNLRTRVGLALKGNPKSETTMKLVSCSIETLIHHLSCKFYDRKDGLKMSLDNYGLWHVDHIKPCYLFNLSKKSEQKKCFHYINLQPLWAVDNLKKSKNYD